MLPIFAMSILQGQVRLHLFKKQIAINSGFSLVKMSLKKASLLHVDRVRLIYNIVNVRILIKYLTTSLHREQDLKP